MWKFTIEWNELADLIINRSSRRQNIDSIIRLGNKASQEYIERRGVDMVCMEMYTIHFVQV